MPNVLLAAVLLLPFAEIATFIVVGQAIGVLPTLALAVAAAVAGMIVIRTQSQRTAGELRAAMSGLSDPTVPLAEGAIALFAGTLLIVPGFLTDIAALALLAPPVRRLVLARFARRAMDAGVRRDSGAQSVIIDAEYHEVDPDDPPGRDRLPPSGWTRH